MKKITKRLLTTMVLSACLLTTFAQTFKGERSDFRDETIYFAMTTRFYDGDPKNNVCGWDYQYVQIANGDPDWRGDFKGLIEKLDYIKALGFTAIWITPVVQNCSGTDFHGYHSMDMSKVDLRYESRKNWGSSEDVTFQSLIDAAHAKGMKIILDIVLNHTGNFGEANLCNLFTRSQNIKDQASVSAAIIPNYEKLPANYNELNGIEQYNARFPYLKNTDGTNKDNHNYWHHVGTGWNWDYPDRWWGQIAGDCVDLNTENPAVSRYLVECYGEFIKMGVDGFRIDTTGHISRLTFNTSFIPQFLELGEQYKDKRLNGCPFFIFGECCARFSDVTYRDQPNLSSYFYTWKSPQDLVDQWNWDETFWDNVYIPEGADDMRPGNMALCEDEPSVKRESSNVFMQNGAWHEPDYTDYSGFSIIDFPMHYNFNNAAAAVNIAKSGDKYYNDASYNVVYVDSHDYCPGPNDNTRFNGGTAQWAENLSLMFTFRGIPCIYYGSEVEFKKGCKVDAGGTDMPVKDSGRAYFGAYLKGSVSATDFGEYTASGNVSETLNADLSQHIIRLNKIRASVPALRKGQYTFDDCTASGGYAFKRAYKDSYALVALNGGATFSNVPEGTYVDLVTGQSYTPSNGSITVTAPTNQGQLRVLVKDWTGGKVGEDGKFIYDSTPVAHGGSVTFADEPTTEFYTADDAVGQPSLNFFPNGGIFKTETLTVTVTLNDVAVSGWYQIGETGSKIEFNGTSTFTIGADMSYGQSVTVYYGAKDESDNEFTGSVTYKKIDPFAAITIYVKAPSAPNLYAWSTVEGILVEPNGTWPGKTMAETAVVNGETFYWHTFSDLEFVNIVFNHVGNKTADIKNITETRYFEYDGGTNVTDITSTIPVDPYDVRVKADPKSGTYHQSVDVTLSANHADATIIYTLDGSEPNASSPQAIGSKSFTFTETTTLRAAALVDGIMKNPVSYTYTITNTIINEKYHVYFLNTGNWNNIYCYVWNGSNKYSGTWPGQLCTMVDTQPDGTTLWKWEYDGTGGFTEAPAMIIFNNNAGTQTSDKKFVNGACYDSAGNIITGINNITTPLTKTYRIYTLDGRAVTNAASPNELKKGIYIVNGKKKVIL